MKQLAKETKYKRKETRTGCNAQVCFTAEDGKWVLTHCSLEHNHPLVLGLRAEVQMDEKTIREQKESQTGIHSEMMETMDEVRKLGETNPQVQKKGSLVTKSCSSGTKSSQNRRTGNKMSSSSCRYIGVRQSPTGRWVAKIQAKSGAIRTWLGTYDTAEEAAMAYDRAAASQCHLGKAKLNFPDRLPLHLKYRMNNFQGNDDCMEIDAKIAWPTEAVELAFISLMVEEVKKGNRTIVEDVNGNRISTTFSNTGWENIQKGLHDMFKKNWTSSQLKYKYNQLRQRQRDCKAIFNETGMGVAATGILDAPENVWDWLNVVQDNMYSRFNKQGCPEYPNLCYIFEDTNATNAFARPSTRSASNDNLEMQDRDINTNVVEIESSMDVDGVDENPNDGDKVKEKGKERDEVKENSKGKKKTKEGKMDSSSLIGPTLAVMAENSQKKTEMLEEKLATSSALAIAESEALLKNTDTCTILECMKIMQKMDIDGVEFTKGLDRLHAMPVFQQHERSEKKTVAEDINDYDSDTDEPSNTNSHEQFDTNSDDRAYRNLLLLLLLKKK